MRIHVLMDNNAKDGLACEWGLSLLVEHEDATYLYDTGATSAFVDNARAMGVDPADVDACILPHAHFDHTGGLKAFADANERAPIYVASAAKENRYSRAKVYVVRASWDGGYGRKLVLGRTRGKNR